MWFIYALSSVLLGIEAIKKYTQCESKLQAERYEEARKMRLLRLFTSEHNDDTTSESE